MLVLTRRSSESVVLEVPPSPQPRRIEVFVVSLGDSKAEIGFEADKDVNIARCELCRAREEWEAQ